MKTLFFHSDYGQSRTGRQKTHPHSTAGSLVGITDNALLMHSFFENHHENFVCKQFFMQIDLLILKPPI